jgi:Ca2+-binding EF-hand superfamily protein
MRTRRNFICLIAVGLALGGAAPAGAAAVQKRSRTALQQLDPDNDGTVDLNEARKAGSAMFDRLDRNKGGTLNRRELGGRVTAAEFAAADPDKDGTLTKDEYLTIVDKRFKAADPDNDGTLDDKELRSRAGRALLRLLLPP